MKSIRFFFSLAILAFAFSLPMPANAQTFTTLASFDGTNGSYPAYGSLVQDANGNYYGTTSQGGKYGDGVIFRVTPAGKLSDIYNFCSQANCTDGKGPSSSVVLGSDGSFYGTTNVGGSKGVGTVFKMTIAGKLTTLYSFCPAGGSCTDGANPVGLVHARNGRFYGTTSTGGNGGGTIFEISSLGKFKTLYSFCSAHNCTDGSKPLSGPIQGNNGSLYGTTSAGGANGSGTAYEIATSGGPFRTLYTFCAQANCADGASPFSGLVQGSNGNLYGTTFSGGANQFGTVFEITPTDQMITLHSFNSADGAYPVSGLIQGSDGNVYGTTTQAGAHNGGTIFEITSADVFSSLYSFCEAPGCGYYPGYSLAQATNGGLIGATSFGGTKGYGTVFSFATRLDPLVETLP